MPPKARTTRKPAAHKPVAKATTPGVLQLDRAENTDRLAAMIADREPLFSIDGVEYTIPKQVPTAWSMKTIDLAMTAGESDALVYAASMMLGDEGYEALKNCPTLMPEDLRVVFNAIIKKVVPEGSFAPKAP